MKVLHILKSEPDEAVQQFMEAFSDDEVKKLKNTIHKNTKQNLMEDDETDIFRRVPIVPNWVVPHSRFPNCDVFSENDFLKGKKNIWLKIH